MQQNTIGGQRKTPKICVTVIKAPRHEFYEDGSGPGTKAHTKAPRHEFYEDGSGPGTKAHTKWSTLGKGGE